MKSGAAQKYPVMSLEDICKLKINDVIEENALLFLWVPNSMILSHAPKVLEAWGFTYRALFIWEKIGWGLGFWFRNCTECLIVASKGKVKPFRMQKRNILKTKRLRHSEKPEEVRQMIDEIAMKTFGAAAKKLELFARKQTEGWTSYGFDVDGVSVEEKICPQFQEKGIIMT